MEKGIVGRYLFLSLYEAYVGELSIFADVEVDYNVRGDPTSNIHICQ